jgi:hypothetical protein
VRIFEPVSDPELPPITCKERRCTLIKRLDEHHAGAENRSAEAVNSRRRVVAMKFDMCRIAVYLADG